MSHRNSNNSNNYNESNDYNESKMTTIQVAKAFLNDLQNEIHRTKKMVKDEVSISKIRENLYNKYDEQNGLNLHIFKSKQADLLLTLTYIGAVSSAITTTIIIELASLIKDKPSSSSIKVFDKIRDILRNFEGYITSKDILIASNAMFNVFNLCLKNMDIHMNTLSKSMSKSKANYKKLFSNVYNLVNGHIDMEGTTNLFVNTIYHSIFTTMTNNEANTNKKNKMVLEKVKEIVTNDKLSYKCDNNELDEDDIFYTTLQF